MRSFSVSFLLYVVCSVFWCTSFGYANPLETRVKKLEALVSSLSQLEASQTTPSGVSHLKLPESIELCGVKVPIHEPEVHQRIEFEFLLMLHDRAQVTIWQRRAQSVFPKFTKHLKQRKVCPDLKYLALIESGLRPSALSSAKAKGYWQFIPGTAKIYGLKTGGSWDQRADLDRSTNAAITFLSELKTRFGSWPLAMAAYNTGPTRLSGAMTAQHVKDYWRLRLYREAERYVPRVIAAKIIMRDLEKWGFADRVTPGWDTEPVDYVRVRLKARETLELKGVANGGGLDYRALSSLNPEMPKSSLTGPLSVVIEIPKGNAKTFRKWVQSNIKKKILRNRKKRSKRSKRSKKKNIPRKSVKSRKRSSAKKLYTVSRGDTLWGVAEKFGVSVKDLRKLNRLRGNSTIRAGDTIVVKRR
jgi:membrane-bound lytic murein transglycosylase D